MLAVGAQAQFFGYPYAGLRATTAGIPATATVPAPFPVAYGYPSISATQYHAQDELGQASFGYAHPGQAASNLRDGFGNQIGSYAYINPEGKEVRVSYTADSRGFRVQSNNLPIAPAQIVDTPEVAAAKVDHAAAIAAAKSGVAPVAPVAPAVALPAPVQDTPEVAAAKAEFAVKFAAAKSGRAKRQVNFCCRRGRLRCHCPARQWDHFDQGHSHPWSRSLLPRRLKFGSIASQIVFLFFFLFFVILRNKMFT